MFLSAKKFGVISERLAIRDMRDELMDPQVKEKLSSDEIKEKVRLGSVEIQRELMIAEHR